MTLFGPEPARDWKMGYSLEQLRAYAEVFRERHKPLVFGAFGMVRERDIAAALSAKRFLLHCFPGGGPTPDAAAIFRILHRPSRWIDFRGEEVAVLLEGDMLVEALAACSHLAGVILLEQVRNRAHSCGRLYVEIFEEDLIARRLMRDKDFVWLGSKVEAGSEVKGLYLDTTKHRAELHCFRDAVLPSAEEATLVPLFEAPIQARVLAQMEDELRQATQLWAQHYSNYNKRSSWTAFALRGYSVDPTFIIKPAEMSRSWREANPQTLEARSRWTKAASLFPGTLDFVKGLFGGNFDRVRFMRLRARDGELSRHADITDREAGVADGKVARIHLPIRTSSAVTFYAWTARGVRLERKFAPGQFFYLDQRKPHAVRNEDPERDRVHLVIDCISSDGLRQTLCKTQP